MTAASGPAIDDARFQQMSVAAVAALRNPSEPSSMVTLSELVQARPDRAESWFNLAYVQRVQGQYAEALTSYKTALSLGIVKPEEVRLNCAVLLSEFLGDLHAAKLELEESIRLDPAFVSAWLNLAMLEEDLGDHAAADLAYQRVLKVVPGQPRALARRAMLAKTNESHIGNLKAAIGRTRDPLEQAELGLALASVYDAIGEYDRAFDAASHANLVARTSMPAQFRYKPAATAMMVQTLMSQPWPSPVGKTDQPSLLFICGLFRSGSTLIEHVIAGHPKVVRGGEKDTLPRLVARYLPGFPDIDLDPAIVANINHDYLKTLPITDVDNPTFTDKRCDNLLYCGVARNALPSSKFVITQRHPLDNLISLFFLDFGYAVPYACDLDAATHWCVEARKLSAYWSQSMPKHVHILDYDAFVEQPEVQTGALFDFVGLSEIASNQPRPARADIVQTPSNWAVRQPVFKTSSGRWKHYEKHLGPQIDILAAAGLLV